jgi:hypothetical protein
VVSAPATEDFDGRPRDATVHSSEGSADAKRVRLEERWWEAESASVTTKGRTNERGSQVTTIGENEERLLRVR